MVVIILLTIFVFSLYMAVITSKAQKKGRIQYKEKLESKNATLSMTAPHLIGLSIPTNTLTTIYSCLNTYEFEANSITYSLSKDKVIDVSLKTDTEIQKQSVSSIGGAIGGAVLFGPLGAMIGGRAKTKELRTLTHCLIFTYEKEDKIDYIAFNATGLSSAKDFIKEFQETNKNKEQKKIEL